MIENEQYLKLALQAVKKAGKIFKQSYGRPRDIKTKNNNPKDFVTDVDLRIEKLIRCLVLKKYPDHKFIGEEFGRDAAGKKDFTWIVDPIDGTANFVHGVPFCCVSLALWQGNDPLAAVIYNPILNNLYTAVKRRGAFLNGKEIQVSSAKKLSDSFGGIGWGRNIILAKKMFPQLIEQVNKARTLGSAALELCEVASGNFDYYVHGQISVWDVAASVLLICEAGGKVSDWQGKPLTTTLKNLVACNGHLQKELLGKIKKLKI